MGKETQSWTLDEVRTAAMYIQSLKRFVDHKDITALILFLTWTRRNRSLGKRYRSKVHWGDEGETIEENLFQ